MIRLKLSLCLSAILLLGVALPSPAAIRLTPITQAGFSSPVFFGHAGDGFNRKFIVEQAGVIKVLQPDGLVASAFLDIRTKIASGGERGLLGLAFHPGYKANGRFFVYYTRTGDGALVIAEYHVVGNPNIADPAETVLLTIPHPSAANHNGGMLAFGPDGYLYAGIGDGGSGNDPSNNAQNKDSLLGKILRIDVDRPDTASGTPYSSPADNPYAGAIPGRDEIYSIGWRNPWRFSFDRGAPFAMWVADVGQGAREEVNTPVVKGGNYGWRVYEGSSCTNNDPALCNPASYIAPLFEYTHSGGRCSITGGYVYRGVLGTFPLGTYIYGDYCTGEIFMWDGSSQSLLLDTTMSIASFGEDEQGELYVVDNAGTVSRIELVPSQTGVIEFYNVNLDHYFLTSDVGEAAGIDAGNAGPGWRRTGASFNPGGTVQVCRFYGSQSPGPNSHFYTSDAAECDFLRQLQASTPATQKRWNFEGLAFAATPAVNRTCPTGTVPVYRAYNDGFARGIDSNHRITTSVDGIREVVNRGWRDEGVVMCVPEVPRSP